MSTDDDIGISATIDLAEQSYVEGNDFQLLCCGSSKSGAGFAVGSRDMWVSAAELVYEFTGNPGSVVRNLITFDLGNGDRIDINLLDGGFEIHQAGVADKPKGRKAIELLMQWKKLSFVEAIEFIAHKYSPDQAMLLGEDYVRMKLKQYVTRTTAPSAP